MGDNLFGGGNANDGPPPGQGGRGQGGRGGQGGNNGDLFGWNGPDTTNTQGNQQGAGNNGDLYNWNGPNGRGGNGGSDQIFGPGQSTDNGNSDPFANDRMPGGRRATGYNPEGDQGFQQGDQGDRPVRQQIYYSPDGSSVYINNFYKSANVIENAPQDGDYRTNPQMDFRNAIPHCQNRQQMDQSNYYNKPDNGGSYTGDSPYYHPDQQQQLVDNQRVRMQARQQVMDNSYQQMARQYAGQEPNNCGNYYDQPRQPNSQQAYNPDGSYSNQAYVNGNPNYYNVGQPQIPYSQNNGQYQGDQYNNQPPVIYGNPGIGGGQYSQYPPNCSRHGGVRFPQGGINGGEAAAAIAAGVGINLLMNLTRGGGNHGNYYPPPPHYYQHRRR